jgi:hypothetical protein
MIRAAIACIALLALTMVAEAQPIGVRQDRIGPLNDRHQGGTQINRTTRLERIALASSAAREALAGLPVQPIDEQFFALARERIGGRLEALRLAGGLAGRRSNDAWYARCDNETTPRALRRLGRLRCEIGVAVEKAGEFHIQRLERSGFPRSRR